MDAAGQVQETPPQERDDVSYWPRGVVQCTLPHSNPGNVRAYVRRSGNYFIMIEPGAKLDPDLGDVDSWGYPYGSYPRLCCSYIAREVRRTKNSRVFLGDTQQNRYTLSAFMAELGLVPTGGDGARSLPCESRFTPWFTPKLLSDMAAVKPILVDISFLPNIGTYGGTSALMRRKLISFLATSILVRKSTRTCARLSLLI